MADLCSPMITSPNAFEAGGEPDHRVESHPDHFWAQIAVSPCAGALLARARRRSGPVGSVGARAEQSASGGRRAPRPPVGDRQRLVSASRTPGQMMPTTIEHTSRRTYGVETRGEPNMPELTGNSRMSQSSECTCNTLQIVVLVTNHATLPAVNQAGPTSPNSRGF